MGGGEGGGSEGDQLGDHLATSRSNPDDGATGSIGPGHPHQASWEGAEHRGGGGRSAFRGGGWGERL